VAPTSRNPNGGTRLHTKYERLSQRRPSRLLSPSPTQARRNRLVTDRFRLRGRKRAHAPRSSRRPQRTTSSTARRHSAGNCFVPDCERVRVNGGAVPRVLQGGHVGARRTPCLRPRGGIRAEPARRPGKRGNAGRRGCPRALSPLSLEAPFVSGWWALVAVGVVSGWCEAGWGAGSWLGWR
jgi:hypothetical protein